MSKEPCCAKPVKGPKGDPGDPPIWGNITGDPANQADLYGVFATTDDLNAGLLQAQGNLDDAIAQEVIDRNAAIAAGGGGGGGGPVAFSAITGDPYDNSALTVALNAKANAGDVSAVTSVNGDAGVVVLDLDDIGDGATNKGYTGTEKTKLSGIEDGATANSSDATLLDRDNHTGTQLASTISDFDTAADVRAAAAISTHVGQSDPHTQYQKESEKGAANGYASLDSGGLIPSSQLPSIAITEFLGASANQAAMLALTGEKGDWTTRSDLGTTWVITGSDPTSLSDWTEMVYPASPVTSVNGATGAVSLDYTDVGADAAGAATSAQAYAIQRANHTGTQVASTISDFVSSVLSAALTGLSTASSAVVAATDNILGAIGQLQAQITLRAPIDSPVFTGNPTVPTQSTSDNSTRAASTAFVHANMDTLWNQPVTDSIGGLIEVAADTTYRLGGPSAFAYTIESLDVETGSGTITAAVKINGTAVTGLSAVAASSTPASATATAANVVAVGDYLTFVTSANSGATGLLFGITITRTP